MTVAEVAAPIALAVLKVAVVALLGYGLARRAILHPAALTDLSNLVIKVAVPCLIFVNAAAGTTGLSLASTAAALAAGPLLLAFGYTGGVTAARLSGVQPGHWRAVVAASTFQNANYLPIAVATSVLPPLAAAFPTGIATAAGGIAANSLVANSLFVAFYSPLFWGIGLWWITEGQAKEGRFAWLLRLLPPPVIGVLAGNLVGLTPLHLVLTPPAAPLHFLFQSIGDIGSLTIPLANLILGGMLAQALTSRTALARDVFCVLGVKLLLTPGLMLLILWATRSWWTHDAPLALAAFIIFLQSTSPPATNLAVMTKGYTGAEGSQTPLVIPGLLLAAYPAAMLTMPLWLLAFFRLLSP